MYVSVSHSQYECPTSLEESYGATCTAVKISDSLNAPPRQHNTAITFTFSSSFYHGVGRGTYREQRLPEPASKGWKTNRFRSQ